MSEPQTVLEKLPIEMLIVHFSLILLFFLQVEGATVEHLESIFFRLYINNQEKEFVDKYINNATDLIPLMNLEKKTVLYIHGFTESVNSTSVKIITAAYQKRQDYNLIIVDWRELAGANYIRVVSDVEEVGAQIAIGLTKMSEAGLNRETLHIVGHSMGAHVAGVIGEKTLFTIPRITGLDPAGPLFNFISTGLSDKNAAFVDIIHTDARFYGNLWSSGSVDFWPNKKSRVQPGCPTNPAIYSKEDFCSHHRSWIYWAESLNRENSFLSIPCSNNLQPSSRSKKVPMGIATPSDVEGTFCLITAEEAPFGLGIDGAKEA